jgi:hypothetical protein
VSSEPEATAEKPRRSSLLRKNAGLRGDSEKSTVGRFYVAGFGGYAFDQDSDDASLITGAGASSRVTVMSEGELYFGAKAGYESSGYQVADWLGGPPGAGI